MFATIGECVVGANAARALGGVKPGDRFFTDPASLSELAGVFPLELTVTGVLAPTQSPDDGAIFVDLRTMWTIRGLGHRHDEPAQSATPGAVIGTVPTATGDNKIAGEALSIARAAAEGVAADFHFHGSTDDFPIDGAIVRPADAKAQAILLGRFTGKDERLQLMRAVFGIEALIPTLDSELRAVASLAEELS
jgi:putative ABC transport system permease protein